jgi:hypothetical protein
LDGLGAKKAYKRTAMRLQSVVSFFVLNRLPTFVSGIRRTFMKKGKLQRYDLMDIFPKIPGHDEYLLALGKFINLYAQIEKELVVVLANYGNLSPNIAKALFSNARPDTTMTGIRRVVHVRKLRGPRIKELYAVLDQLGKITRLRNDLVHLGGLPKRDSEGVNHETKFEISNQILAHSRKVRRTIPITAKILDDAHGDLVAISLRLVTHMKIKLADPKLDWFGAELLKGFRRANPISRPPAWFYKPHEKVARRRKRPAQHQARATPPRPSST